MTAKQKIIIALLVSLIFTGCRAQEPPKPQDMEEKTEITEDTVQDTEKEAGVHEETKENADQPALLEPLKLSGKAVGIEAHIKEVREQEILISSDCDDFPGAFAVEVPESVFDVSLLMGGTPVRIVMEEKEGTGENTKYQARGIEIVQEQEETAASGEEVPRLSPPSFVLGDPLSSIAASFEIHPGNYNWNYKDGDEMAGVIACGVHPLDDIEREKLKLPRYNGMETGVYVLSTDVSPDMLIINVWDAEDIGNTQAETGAELTLYFPVNMLELEIGKVYEFTAVWAQEKLEQRGFYGDAGYTLVTE